MTRLRKDFGIIDPIKLAINNRVILYNPITQKKLFTDKDNINHIDEESMSIIKNGLLEFDLPSIKKYRVEIDLNCNCLCDYCLVYKNNIPHLHEKMSVSTAKKIIDRFNSAIKNGSVMLIGGEPLLNMDVIELFIKELKGRVNIYTNGTLINNKIANLLSESHVTTYISFDGRKNENFHRKFIDGTESFDLSMKGYLNLKEANAKTAITCLVTDDNVDHLEEIVHYFFSEFKENSFGLSMPHYTKEGLVKIDVEKYSSAMVNIFQYAKANNIYIDQIAKILSPMIYEKPTIYSCKIAGEQITFYPNGSSTLCTKLDSVGLNNLSSNDMFSQVPIFDASCTSCEAITLCGGGCFWDMIYDNAGKDSKTCYFTKKMVNSILWDMYDSVNKQGVISPLDLEKIYINLLKK